MSPFNPPNADGTVTYTPNTNFAGTDSWSYRLKDSKNHGNWAVVSMLVDDADIEIYNGGKESRYAITGLPGTGTPNDTEETVGAFTVANLNDTDGDGKADNAANETDVRVATGLAQTTVTGFSLQTATVITVANGSGFLQGQPIAINSFNPAFTAIRKISNIQGNQITLDRALDEAPPNGAVVRNNLGEDEIDLMKIVIHKPQALIPGRSLTLQVAGPAKVWEHSWKGTAVPTVAGVITIDTRMFDNGDITWWVEATDVSSSIRDIELTLTNGNGDKKGVDVVKATGIWASVTADRSATEIAPEVFCGQVWEDIPSDDGARGVIEKVEGTGIRESSPSYGVANGIIFQFTIRPAGIDLYTDIKVDPSRRADTRAWERSDTDVNWDELTNIDYRKDPPVSIDRANDDKGNGDESSVMQDHQYFYSADAPGLTTDHSGTPPKGAPQQVVEKFNFQEFLRVTIGGTRPVGDTLSGSHMSDFYDWYSVVHIDDDANKIYQRVGSPDNSIGPGRTDQAAP